jgi:hypothetical protein
MRCKHKNILLLFIMLSVLGCSKESEITESEDFPVGHYLEPCADYYIRFENHPSEKNDKIYFSAYEDCLKLSTRLYFLNINGKEANNDRLFGFRLNTYKINLPVKNSDEYDFEVDFWDTDTKRKGFSFFITTPDFSMSDYVLTVSESKISDSIYINFKPLPSDIKKVEIDVEESLFIEGEKNILKYSIDYSKVNHSDILLYQPNEMDSRVYEVNLRIRAFHYRLVELENKKKANVEFVDLYELVLKIK